MTPENGYLDLSTQNVQTLRCHSITILGGKSVHPVSRVPCVRCIVTSAHSCFRFSFGASNSVAGVLVRPLLLMSKEYGVALLPFEELSRDPGQRLL